MTKPARRVAFQPIQKLEGFEKLPGAERSLLAQLNALKLDLAALQARPEFTELKTGDYLAREDEHVRYAPHTGGATLLVPRARPENQGSKVVILLENVSRGSLTVQCVGGQVNQLDRITLSAPGRVDLISNGIDGWVSENAPGTTGATGASGASSSLRGHRGEDGERGPRGPAGVSAAGKTGAPGRKGLDGEDGQRGQRGAIGITGKTGATGPRGPRGMPGESAPPVSRAPTPGWSRVLAAENNSGPYNPNIDANQFIGFGLESLLFPTGDIRAASTFTIGAGSDISLVNSGGDITLEAPGGVCVVDAQDGLYISSTGGHSRIVLDDEASSLASIGANQLAIWADDQSPPQLMVKDDIGEDWEVGYNGLDTKTSTSTTLNSTSNITGTSFTVPADTARAGTAFRQTLTFLYTHTAATTPTLTAELLIAGAVVQTAVFTPLAFAATFYGEVVALLTVRTTGAGGTCMCSLQFKCGFGNTIPDSLAAGATIATTAFDTTIDETILLRIRMTTAVASNQLDVVQGITERLR